MAKKGAREVIGLICPVCKSQNYVTERNKLNLELKSNTKKLTVKKYCKRCRKYQEHKETTKLK